jgi:hypothetical protein
MIGHKQYSPFKVAVNDGTKVQRSQIKKVN